MNRHFEYTLYKNAQGKPVKLIFNEESDNNFSFYVEGDERLQREWASKVKRKIVKLKELKYVKAASVKAHQQLEGTFVEHPQKMQPQTQQKPQNVTISEPQGVVTSEQLEVRYRANPIGAVNEWAQKNHIRIEYTKVGEHGVKLSVEDGVYEAVANAPTAKESKKLATMICCRDFMPKVDSSHKDVKLYTKLIKARDKRIEAYKKWKEEDDRQWEEQQRLEREAYQQLQEEQKRLEKQKEEENTSKGILNRQEKEEVEFKAFCAMSGLSSPDRELSEAEKKELDKINALPVNKFNEEPQYIWATDNMDKLTPLFCALEDIHDLGKGDDIEAIMGRVKSIIETPGFSLRSDDNKSSLATFMDNWEYQDIRAIKMLTAILEKTGEHLDELWNVRDLNDFFDDDSDRKTAAFISLMDAGKVSLHSFYIHPHDKDPEGDEVCSPLAWLKTAYHDCPESCKALAETRYTDLSKDLSCPSIYATRSAYEDNDYGTSYMQNNKNAAMLKDLEAKSFDKDRKKAYREQYHKLIEEYTKEASQAKKAQYEAAHAPKVQPTAEPLEKPKQSEISSAALMALQERFNRHK